MRGAASAVARLVLAVALTALAGLSFAPVFGGFRPSFLLAVLVPPAVVLVWALWVRRAKEVVGGAAKVSPAAAAAGLLAVVVAVAAITTPGVDVASGPYQLLTSVLPTDPVGPPLATASALAGFTALVGCFLVLTVRSAVASVLPAVICLLAGLGLGAATGPLPVWYAPAFVGLAGLQLAVRRMADDRLTVGVSRLVTAVVVLTTGIATPVALAGVLPGANAREPADLRSLVDRSVRPKSGTNPFAQFHALQSGKLELKLTGRASDRLDRLRMVTLTEFDGRMWSTRATYTRVGHRLPSSDSPTASRPVTLDIKVATPRALGWLPVPGRATDISVAGLGVDETTGDVVVPAGVTTPMAYRVSGAETLISGVELLRSEPARATDESGLTLPSDVTEFLERTTPDELSDSARLRALYRTFKTAPYGYDEPAEAVGGHGLYQISALLRDKHGTSEQFASAFAVLCRHLGWDARVVLGFRPQWTGHQLVVTGRDVHAWTEVRYDHLGWVPIDPIPGRAADSGEPVRGPGSTDPLDSLDSDRETRSEPGTGHTEPSAPTHSASRDLVGMAAAVAVILVIVLAVPAAKVLRRARRRRTGSSRERGLAAWHEALDALKGAGVCVPHFATTSEIVTTCEKLCLPALLSLARRTDIIAFAPDETTDDQARAAWADSDTVRAAVHREMGVAARVRAALDPRSLWTRRVHDHRPSA